jgi:hypothetical protein
MLTEPRDSLFDFRVFVRVSKPDFPRMLYSNFKLFEHQTVRSSRVHCILLGETDEWSWLPVEWLQGFNVITSSDMRFSLFNTSTWLRNKTVYEVCTYISCADRKEEKGESDESRDVCSDVRYKSKVAYLKISRTGKPTKHGGTCKYSEVF